MAESNRILLSVISRDRAVIDLLRMAQEDKNAMEFVGEVEDQVRLCRAELTQNQSQREI